MKFVRIFFLPKLTIQLCTLASQSVQYLLFVYVCRKAIPTGMVSGAAAQFLASPTDLVKVHMQMEGKRQLEGLKPRLAILVSR